MTTRRYITTIFGFFLLSIASIQTRASTLVPIVDIDNAPFGLYWGNQHGLQFTSPTNAYLTGIGIRGFGSSPPAFSLYSSVDNLPTLFMGNFNTFSPDDKYSSYMTAIYNGEPLLLEAGTPYYIVGSASDGFVWLASAGGGSYPGAYSSGGPWDRMDFRPQVEVYGTEVTDTPEPTSMVLLGAGLLGLAGLRRRLA